MAPKVGDISSNLTRHEQYIKQARDEGADVVVFPELALTGYQLQDLTLDVARRLDSEDIQHIIAQSQDIDIAFSFIEESDEHFFYVAGVYASNGEVSHVHRKAYLPTYGMFDEQRYVAAGKAVKPFAGLGTQVGMMICEDAWHVSVPYLLTMQGATMLFVQSSSPGRNMMDRHAFGSQAFWHQLIQMYGQLFGVHIAFCNRVGYEDGVYFYGGSGVVGPDGRFIGEVAKDEETLLTVRIDARDVRRARYTTPLLRDERMDLTLSHLMQLQGK